MYETGISTGVVDLVQKISGFAQRAGWTVLKNENNTLLLQNTIAAENYFSISSHGNNEEESITVACLTADALVEDSNKPNQKRSVNTNRLYPPFVGYHFFGQQQYLHIVIEINNGLFAHTGIGVLNKASQYAGGGYVYRTSYDSSAFYDRNVKAYNKYPFEDYSIHYDGRIHQAVDSYPREYGLMKATGPFHWSPNQMNGVAPLFPFLSAVVIDNATFLLGHAPDVRSVKIDYLQDGESVFFGNDEWVCFPIKRKALSKVPEGEFTSDTYGIAYKKIDA